MMFKKIRNNQDKEKPGFAGRVNVLNSMIVVIQLCIN